MPAAVDQHQRNIAAVPVGVANQSAALAGNFQSSPDRQRDGLRAKAFRIVS